MEGLPVPLRLTLPGLSWRAVAPAAIGVRNAAFTALRDDTPGGYTPVLSVSGGWRDDDASLERIADEAVERLRAETGTARLTSRRTAGGPRTPAISQVVRTELAVAGTVHDLVRLQALLGFLGHGNDPRRAVVIIGCTCLVGQLDPVAEEFAAVVAGLRPDQPRGG